MLYSPERPRSPEQEKPAYDFSGSRELAALLKKEGAASLEAASDQQREQIAAQGAELFEKEALPYGTRAELTQELSALFEHRGDIASLIQRDPRPLFIFSHGKALIQEGKLTEGQLKAYLSKRLGWKTEEQIDTEGIDALLFEFSKSHRDRILATYE